MARRSQITASLTLPRVLLTIDETFDIGSDTRTPVDDKDYQVPFRFNGKIDRVAFRNSGRIS